MDADTLPDQPSNNSRTHYEAEMDVAYGVRFNELNERFYRRLDSVFSFCGALGGSAVFASWLGDKPLIAGIIGPALVILTYIEREIRPAQKAVRCAVQREKFGALASRTPTTTLVDVDRELRILQSNCPDTIGALEVPAWNAVMRSKGHYDRQLSLNRLSKAAMVLA
ncbi:hypothetical protein CAL21_20530 [Bordetella genomosp. 4]|nr:hypothetical protein CAL21_20530 [Bordetella genomosp. 4]